MWAKKDQSRRHTVSASLPCIRITNYDFWQTANRNTPPPTQLAPEVYRYAYNIYKSYFAQSLGLVHFASAAWQEEKRREQISEADIRKTCSSRLKGKSVATVNGSV